MRPSLMSEFYNYLWNLYPDLHINKRHHGDAVHDCFIDNVNTIPLTEEGDIDYNVLDELRKKYKREINAKLKNLKHLTDENSQARRFKRYSLHRVPSDLMDSWVTNNYFYGD